MGRKGTSLSHGKHEMLLVTHCSLRSILDAEQGEYNNESRKHNNAIECMTIVSMQFDSMQKSRQRTWATTRSLRVKSAQAMFQGHSMQHALKNASARTVVDAHALAL